MRQQIVRAMLIVFVGTLVGIAYAVTATNTDPRPASYREAVRRVLDERRVDYRDILVVDGCAPSYQFCRTYAGSVQVLATTTVPGQIDCRERWTTCTLTVPQLEIKSVPLDDVLNPILARWEALNGQLMLKLQCYRGSGGNCSE